MKQVQLMRYFGYADQDNDGYGTAAFVQRSCEQPSGYIEDDSDCNDSDPSIHPNAAEICVTD